MSNQQWWVTSKFTLESVNQVNLNTYKVFVTLNINGKLFDKEACINPFFYWNWFRTAQVKVSFYYEYGAILCLHKHWILLLNQEAGKHRKRRRKKVDDGKRTILKNALWSDRWMQKRRCGSPIILQIHGTLWRVLATLGIGEVEWVHPRSVGSDCCAKFNFFLSHDFLLSWSKS